MGILQKIVGGAKKTVLFTGSTGRLGSFFAARYGNQYKIIGVARRQPASPLPFLDFIACDLGSGLDPIFERIASKQYQIDVVINAAVGSRWVGVANKTMTEFQREFAINVAVPLELSNRILQSQWEGAGSEKNHAHNRSVVNLSSTAGVYVYPGSGQGAYAAEKAALNMLSRHMALEYEPFGIRVNAIAPNTFPRIVSVERVAQSVAECIEGDFTGKILVVDRVEEKNHEGASSPSA